ncbi:Integrase catalytic domain-containing protein [Abeliophyllum distichum]|uniref:Integrase catalytic domain-containing protein n=1 Tax=Abeliophyllum distichum TaxID=126358 RepID=A0ABD1TY29_9LAMI
MSFKPSSNIWDSIKLPHGKSVVGYNVVYKIKIRVDGSVERYKARLMAWRFTQEYATRHLIGTLPDKWQDMAEMVYDLLWASVVPFILQEIDYKVFCVELMALWEEARDDALEFSKAERVLLEMRICEDAPSPISDIEK